MIWPLLFAGGTLYAVTRPRRGVPIGGPIIDRSEWLIAGCDTRYWPVDLRTFWAAFIADPTGWVRAHYPEYGMSAAAAPYNPANWPVAVLYVRLVRVGCASGAAAVRLAWNAVRAAMGLESV